MPTGYAIGLGAVALLVVFGASVDSPDTCESKARRDLQQINRVSGGGSWNVLKAMEAEDDYIHEVCAK